MRYLSNISIQRGPIAQDRTRPWPSSWAAGLPAHQLGSSGNRASICIIVAIVVTMATAHCRPGRDALPTLRSPAAGMQSSRNSSFYLLPNLLNSL